jgi:hypothetical protein
MDLFAIVLIPALLLLGIVIVGLVLTALDRQRLRHLAAERQGDSICRFARSLDYRRLDTKVIRAVYETLQDHLRFVCPAFPIRSSDDIVQDLLLDPGVVEDLVCEVADRCGRRLDSYERNPFHQGLYTVSGLIEFLCLQPKAQTT